MSRDQGPVISVVIPHFNAHAALSRCLAGLATQEADGIPFEVIVVDNGSALRPEAECTRYSFVRLDDEPRPGPGPARNRGAHLAQGPILAFLDCDCLASPAWIAAIARHFVSRPEVDAIGGDVRIDCLDPARPTTIEAYESVYGYRMELYIRRDGYAATCNMAVRREAFSTVGGFGGIDIAEDVDWGRRAKALGLRLEYVPEMRVATPARTDFLELARKWDRHIGHDFTEVQGRQAKLRWLARALALALSPLPEVWRVARSDRVTGFDARARALACLIRIRLYRSGRMIALLLGASGSASGAWRGEA